MANDIVILLSILGIAAGAISALLFGMNKEVIPTLVSLALLFQSWVLYFLVK